MKYSTAFLGTLAGILLSAVLAADVTLYRLGADPASPAESILQSAVSLAITPVAVEKSGETVYVAVEAQSRAVYTSRFQTVTLIATPRTDTYTFRADATHYRLALETVVDGAKGHREEDCNTGGDGRMVCQAKMVIGDSHTTVTIATTSTGVARPWFTISNAENLQLPTTSSAALPARQWPGIGTTEMIRWTLPTIGFLVGVFLL